MTVISYSVRVEFQDDSRIRAKYIEFELYDAHGPDDHFLRSLDLRLKWVHGKNGEFRKAV